ncbi:hypothetical protein SKAU_G00047860 [Synaphobranchus kaupii]|uniref:Kit ligand n=1 Tax=Synaphobranchus kaupii TaxID=118154 RepID=A0A9Q1J8C9_SYNKA|nr:hypothetical protein SKAU_G00047860 [Synaphobranchus kaupii]
MKKAKIWIRACVCILLYTTFAACSRGTGSQRIDDDDRISFLKQNIPKDYKIPVRFIPKDMSGTCWVELNTFHMEKSLKALAETFGNISSNRNNISIFVQMLEDVRYRIGADMEAIMQDFECHYKREEWQTERFFDYIRDFLSAASSKTESAECDSLPCASTVETGLYSEGPLTTSSPVKTADCLPASDCQTRAERQYLPEDVQKSLLSLFLISIAANICLLILMVRGRRRHSPERTAENRPSSDHEKSVKNRLNSIEMI